MRDIVLVGAGHTHLHVMKEWGRRPISNARLMLISKFPYAAYSGMLPGTLAELYSPDEMLIDLQEFSDRCGVTCVIEDASELDHESKILCTSNGKEISFGIASFGIGSVPAGGEEFQSNPRVIPIKPMQTFLVRLETAFAQQISSGWKSPGDARIRVAIVGGGAAGVEIAFCLNERLFQRGIVAEVLVVESGNRLLHGYPGRLVSRVEKLFHHRGIETRLNSRVVDIHNDQVQLDSGEAIDANLVIWITGAAPPRFLKNVHLPKSENGFLEVESTLQSTSGEPIFVVGDTASIKGHDVPKAGVYAVRQGPILWENLNRFIAGKTLLKYKPQKKFLSLISTGDEKALLEYHGWTMYGTWPWKLKDHIDRSFIRQYQV